VTNIGGDEAGGRTAVAHGSGSQTAIAVNTGTPSGGAAVGGRFFPCVVFWEEPCQIEALGDVKKKIGNFQL